MKKNIVILGIALIVGIVVFFISTYVIDRLFSSQYNENGVSHFLVVTINENSPREYIGKLKKMAMQIF